MYFSVNFEKIMSLIFVCWIGPPKKNSFEINWSFFKGGDLLKWSRAKIDHFVGVDIAGTSVEQGTIHIHAVSDYKKRWSEVSAGVS